MSVVIGNIAIPVNSWADALGILLGTLLVLALVVVPTLIGEWWNDRKERARFKR